jgi:putative ABC transport system ATP-binding protein
VALHLLIDGKTLLPYRQYIDELLAWVGLEVRADHRPDQLAGGQQQRVAIARAFVNRPEIVLADEPTGNLDSRSGKAVLDLLRRVCLELEATICMVTHDPRAASYAGRVIFLRDGLIVDQLAHEQGVPVHEIIQIMESLEL